MDKKKLIRLAVVLVVVIWFVLLILSLIPDKKEEANVGLKADQSIELLRRVRRTLSNNKGLEGNKFDEDAMIRFSKDYMISSGLYNVDYITKPGYVGVNKNDLLTVAKEVFDKNIDVTTSKYEISGDIIWVVEERYRTDALIYKYNKEMENEDGTYTIYIDCVAPSTTDMYSELSKADVTKYDEEDVYMTYIFKYKIVDNRRVLLAYECDMKY